MSLIQLEGIRKMPKFRPGISQELRSAIPLAKHAEPVEVFSRDGIVASIMTGESPLTKMLLHIALISFPKGTTWMGENLREERKYCDLSLYFSNKELMEVLREGEGMETLVERWLDVSLKVSDRLTEVGKQFNSSKM